MTETTVKEETADTEQSKTNSEIEALAKSYAEYMHFDQCSQIQQFEDSIEELLTKLDEYHGLLDTIRSDTALCLQKNIPIIREKTCEMEKIYDRIDKLELFVAKVKKNMSVIEDKVTKAEADLGTLHGFRKVLSSIPVPSFFSSKPAPIKKPVKYEAPEIFKTKDYFVTNSNTECNPSASSYPHDVVNEQSASPDGLDDPESTVSHSESSAVSQPVILSEKPASRSQSDFVSEICAAVQNQTFTPEKPTASS